MDRVKAKARSSSRLYGPEEILDDIDANSELPELLRSVVEWAAGLLRTDAAEIYLYDPRQEALTLAIGCGSEFVGARVRLGEGLVGKVFQSGEAMIVEDYLSWEGKTAVFAATPPFTTVLSVPLIWQEQRIGALAVVADRRTRTFAAGDIRLATLFANLAAVAIWNAQLHRELQERAEAQKRILERQVAERTAQLAHRAVQLEASARVSREITSILELDDLLTRVVHLLRDVFGYYHAQIFLVDEAANHLVLRADSSQQGDGRKGEQVYLEIGSGSLNSRVAATNEPALVNDVGQEPDYLAEERLPDTRSELVIPLRLGQRVVGTLDIQSDRTDAFTQEDMLVIQTLGDQIAIAIENARLYDRNRELAVLQERTRLARELHDSVTQSLFSLDLHARAVAAYVRKNPCRAEAQIQQLRQITHDTLKEMRCLIYDLRPPSAGDVGLAPALRELIEGMRRPDGPRMELQVQAERRLPCEVEQGLFRIAQEALRNAVKYADATSIEVSLAMGGGCVALCVADDGRGFDTASAHTNHHAFGLIGMRERAALLRADLEVVSHPGAGTQVRVRVPG